MEHFVLPPETIGGARESLKGFLRSSHLSGREPSTFLPYLEAGTFPLLSFENFTLTLLQVCEPDFTLGPNEFS